VAHLIDYLDADNESYSNPDFQGSGIEDRLPEGYFPEPPERARITDVRELQLIPGFTPRRISQLSHYVHTLSYGSVNLNVAPALVIQSLNDGIDEGMALGIYDYVRSQEGPFRAQTRWRETLSELTSSAIQRELGGRVSPTSRDYRVVGKVDYGETSYFMRSRISFTPGQERAGELPKIEELEFFF
jgi:type II secretory pathway component PulK